MAALSIQRGHEVYVYMNGKLIMKKWNYDNGTTRSVHFDNYTYDKHTHRSITEKDGVIIDQINK